MGAGCSSATIGRVDRSGLVKGEAPLEPEFELPSNSGVANFDSHSSEAQIHRISDPADAGVTLRFLSQFLLQVCDKHLTLYTWISKLIQEITCRIRLCLFNLIWHIFKGVHCDDKDVFSSEEVNNLNCGTHNSRTLLLVQTILFLTTVYPVVNGFQAMMLIYKRKIIFGCFGIFLSAVLLQ